MVIHFPIALLTLYSVFEIISIKRVRSLSYWFYVKASLVIFGAGGAVIARQTGELIEDRFVSVKNVVDMHSLWANITVGIFLTLAIIYIIEWIKRDYQSQWLRHKYIAWLWNILVKIQVWLYHRPVLMLAAFVGLVAVTITGALGGSIAHGPDTDPVANFVYHLFF